MRRAIRIAEDMPTVRLNSGYRGEPRSRSEELKR